MNKRIVHIAELAEEDFVSATAQMVKQHQIQHEVQTVATVREITELRVGSTVIIDAHDTYLKLLAYAGPPPREQLSRGITRFSAYIPWVRQVSLGLRTMFPEIKQKEVYERTTQFADWCRQRREK